MIMEPGQISNHVFRAWLECGNTVSEVWTRNRRGLRGNLEERLASLARGIPTVGAMARKNGIPVRIVEPLTYDSKVWSLAHESNADTLIACQTLQIIPGRVIARFGERAVNVHPAMLPHYKGPNPKLSLLIDGRADQFGGVTFHCIVRGIDEGPIIARSHVPWSSAPDYQQWGDAIALAAAEITRKELQDYLSGQLAAIAQPSGRGNYRRCSETEFAVSSERTLNEVRHLFQSAPGHVFRWISQPEKANTRRISVVGMGKAHSPPTGQPPRILMRRIETDLVDARVHLIRRSLWMRFVKHPVQGFLGYRRLVLQRTRKSPK